MVDMKKYIVAADCGTTGSKAVIYDIAGKPVASGYREYGLEFPQPGWVEQDPQMLLDTLLTVISQAAQTANIPAQGVVAICLSTQRCTLIPVDKAANTLTNSLTLPIGSVILP